MNEIQKKLFLIGIVPVITISDAARAVPLADALCAGGISCAEITFRTPAARDAVAAIAKERPDVIVGAGTILTREQVDEAIGAGASFIVTPGYNPEVVKYCIQKGITVIPGVNSPTGVEAAMAAGLDMVKFFPARESGGAEFIKAISAPYPAMKFMPTGGIDGSSFCDYLKCNSVSAVGGSWIAPSALIAEGRFDEITRLCRAAVDRMLNIHPAHIGIYCGSGEVVRTVADELEEIFSFKKDIRNEGCIFAGGSIELLSNAGRGKCGHIALAVSSVDRAVYHLSRRGARFDMSTAQYTPDGSMRFVYLEDERAGFAYHLVIE